MKKVFSLAALLLLSAVLSVPTPVFAAQTLLNVFCTLGGLVILITPMVVALALLAFFWGLAMYMFSLSGAGGSASHSGGYGMPATPENKNAGKTIMLYGVIVLFVMISIWGIVNILQNTFGVGGGSITPPSISGARIESLPSLRCPSN